MPLVHRDRAVVGDAHLERVAVVAPGLVEHLLDHPPGDAAGGAVGVDRDVHQVPDVGVARADEEAGDPVSGRRRQGRRRDGFESSSTNIASDHGAGNERRSIESTPGRSP